MNKEKTTIKDIFKLIEKDHGIKIHSIKYIDKHRAYDLSVKKTWRQFMKDAGF